MSEERSAIATAIEQLRERRERLLNEASFDEMVDGFYAADARLLRPDGPTLMGIEEIRRFWREAPQRGLILLELTPTSADGSGELAYETGVFKRTLRPRHGHPFKDDGKYLVVFRRQADGAFRAEVEMFNSPRGR